MKDLDQSPPATPAQRADHPRGAPDPSQFSKSEYPREYEVLFTVTGSLRVTVSADSKDDAKAKAIATVNDHDGIALELDDVNEIKVDWVRKTPPMYRVTREGKKMQASRLSDGDLPREPDEHGF